MGIAVDVQVEGVAISKENPVPTLSGNLHDSTGAYCFNPDILPNVMTYFPDGTLETITVGPDSDGNSFRQTMTYTNGNLTGVSAWVKL